MPPKISALKMQAAASSKELFKQYRQPADPDQPAEDSEPAKAHTTVADIPPPSAEQGSAGPPPSSYSASTGRKSPEARAAGGAAFSGLDAPRQDAGAFSPAEKGAETASEPSTTLPARDVASVAAVPPTEAETDEWGAATAAAAAELEAASAQVRRPALPISWSEAYRLLYAEGSWRAHLTDTLKRVSANVNTGGLMGRLWACWHHDIVEGSPLYDERDFVLCLQFVPLDHANDVHRRMLLTIYRGLVRPVPSVDPMTTGSEWERLGFQGVNPGTDLRSTGLFGLLQLLYCVDQTPTFTSRMFACATSRLLEFPWALVALNFSGIAVDALKERSLHDVIVSRYKMEEEEKKLSGGGSSTSSSRRVGPTGGGAPPPSQCVARVMNEFFIGVMDVFVEEWQSVASRRITDFDAVKKKLKARFIAKPSEALERFANLEHTQHSRGGGSGGGRPAQKAAAAGDRLPPALQFSDL